jgi:DNA polymerase-3 subunit beta
VKFRCEREALAEAIGIAQRAVASRPGALPALSGNVLVKAENGKLELVGSDLDLTIRVTTDVDADATGSVVVPARLFGDIVRSLEPGAVTVEANDEEARITGGRSQFSVRISGEEFPKLAEPTAGGVRMDSAALSAALRQVVPAASRDDARPILTAVLLAADGSGLRLVATDSYRLAVRDLPGESVLRAGEKVLVPAKALSELQRLLGEGEVEVTFSDREASFDVGRARVSTRLIEGEFPNYQQLIPSGYPNRLTVEREPLIEAVKRVRLVTQGRDTPVRLAMKPDGLELSARSDAGDAQEFLDAKYEGAEMTVAFNPEFILDGLQAIVADEVALETQDALKPATLRAADGGDFLYLLMPVRVS